LNGFVTFISDMDMWLARLRRWPRWSWWDRSGRLSSSVPSESFILISILLLR